MASFSQYFLIKEGKATPSEVKLSDNGDFKPFIIDVENRPSLRRIVKAWLDSPQVPLPGISGDKLTTLDSKKGEQTQKLKKKSLFLVGGAVRDHLLGKTPRGYELVTDATPEEIRLILKHAGFTETKPENFDFKKKNKVFYVNGKGKDNREYSFIVSIDGDNYEIATFRKGGKGKIPDKVEFSSLKDDSEDRDFTINSLYLPLTNADGPNTRLIDPHGGFHHLASGDIQFIGGPEQVISDPMRAFRYARFANQLGKTIPPEIINMFKHVQNANVNPLEIGKEFYKGLQHPDIDPQSLIKTYKDGGLINCMFPEIEISDDLPNTREKKIALAWLLRDNDAENVYKSLKRLGLDEQEIKDILFLLMFRERMKLLSPETVYTGTNDLREALPGQTMLIPSLIKKWGKMNNIDDAVISKFFLNDNEY
jgi:tRNA nucleotidyltransferase/poly(A) polymerase